MNEGVKTGIFAGIAAVALGLALWSRPASVSSERDLTGEIIGNPVFASFDDPAKAASFQIVKFDETLGQLDRFEVARDKATNMWRLPSFEDYPADAAEQVRDATTPLMGLTVLDIQSFDRGDHSLYGVVNPDEEGLSVAETGVGMLVRVKDGEDQVLASLIIGKEVGQAQGQRYVRVPTEDAVYVVELDTNPFTTDFSKWIKGELLGVRSFDITEIGLRDYAVLPTQRGLELRRNFDADVAYEPTTSKWSLAKMVSYAEGATTEVSLGEDEELQTQALNDLRNAVQDLQIVDVRRKPKGLAADLKADKSLLDDQESLQSLYKQGFFPQEMPNGVEIYATAGETIVGTKDGVKYVLRFGESSASLSTEEGTESNETGSGLRRFLLVTAQLDESDFPPPDLKPVPETVEEMLAAERAESGEASESTAPATQEGITLEPSAQEPPVESAVPVDEATTEPTTETSTTDETKPVAESPAEGDSTTTEDAIQEPAEGIEAVEPVGDAPVGDAPVEPTPPSSDEPSLSHDNQKDAVKDQAHFVAYAPNQGGSLVQDGEAQEGGVAQTPPTDGQPPADAQTPAEAQTPADQPPAAVQPPTNAQPPAETQVPAEVQPTATDPAATKPPETAEELQERLEFTREQITKENQRKIDARNEKIDQARKKVQELNARFADWYYIVNDSVYQKLTLPREKLIISKSAQPATEQPTAPGFPEGFPNFQP